MSPGGGGKLLRAKDWLKDGFVLAPPFFSGAMAGPGRITNAPLAFIDQPPLVLATAALIYLK